MLKTAFAKRRGNLQTEHPVAFELTFPELRTGDIGALDAHRYIKVLDRKKDMFLVGGDLRAMFGDR